MASNEAKRKLSEEEYSKYLERLADTLLGPPSGIVIRALAERREATVEWLMKRTGLRQNVIRKVLHELFQIGITDYRREKEAETNWFMYYWRVKHESIAEVMLRRRDKMLKLLKLRLDYEKNNMFFVCPDHPEYRLTFDEAYDYSFKCPECGKVLEQEDNKYLIEYLEYLITRLKEIKPERVIIGDP